MERIRPADFESDTPPNRIIGIECEYNLQTELPITDFMKDGLLRAINIRNKKQFLSNGARLYPELGYLLEYATPESLGPKDAIISDFAGMAIVRSLVEVSGLEYTSLSRATGSFKPEADPAQETRNRTLGYHENYLSTDASVYHPAFEELLPLYLATRVWAGQGTLRGNSFVLSQKVWGTGGKEVTHHHVRRTEAQHKPMITVLKDDDTVNDGWRRIEVRFAEAGQSPAARLASLGGFSVLLRALEHPDFLATKKFANIIPSNSYTGIAKIFAHDTTFKTRCVTESGKSFTVLDFQEGLLEICESLGQEIQLPPDEKLALGLWRRIIDRLKLADFSNQEYAGTDKLLDNAALHRCLSDVFEEDELRPDNTDAMLETLLWDELGNKGIAQKWWSKYDLGIINQEDVSARIYNPPETRAKERARLLKKPKTIKLQWNKRFLANGKTEKIHELYL